MSPELRNRLDDIRRLCQSRGVVEFYAFGSSVEGGFDPEASDYDFLVRFEPCPPSEHADRYFGLLEDLQDLLKAPIDLVEIDAISNPYFRSEAERSRVSLYAA